MKSLCLVLEKQLFLKIILKKWMYHLFVFPSAMNEVLWCSTSFSMIFILWKNLAILLSMRRYLFKSTTTFFLNNLLNVYLEISNILILSLSIIYYLTMKAIFKGEGPSFCFCTFHGLIIFFYFNVSHYCHYMFYFDVQNIWHLINGNPLMFILLLLTYLLFTMF
jgi:hypothetical protein